MTDLAAPAPDPIDAPVEAPPDPWEAAQAIIGTVAPALALAVSGPLKGLALALISRALGLDPAATSDQVADLLKTVSIDQLKALQTAEGFFLAQMKALKISQRQLCGQQSADDTAIFQHSWFPEVFAMTISLLFFILLTFFAWHPIPNGSSEVLNVMLGAVAASFATVVNYFFGSTRASARKDLMLYNSKPA